MMKLPSHLTKFFFISPHKDIASQQNYWYNILFNTYKTFDETFIETGLRSVSMEILLYSYLDWKLDNYAKEISWKHENFY
jgi:hypothetical protein